MKKQLIVSIAVIVNGILQFAVAQQDALFTQYADVQLYANPAVSGSNDHMTITGMHRQQWAGFQGAPMTSGLMLHTPLHYESVGVGVEVWNDRVGTLNRSTLGGNFAYRFKLKRGARLALGIKAVMDLNSADISGLSNGAEDPRALALTNSVTPNAGIGVFYKSRQWFMGAGVPRVLENGAISTNGGYSNQIHVYGIAGILVDMKNRWVLRPSTQVRIVKNAPLSADLTLTVIKDEAIYFGLNYRLLESIGVIAQYRTSPQFKLGYSFDFSTSALLRTTNVGSHEVVLSYDMKFTKTAVVSPRIF